MIGFSESIHVDRPIEVVFDALADMAELDRWNPNVTNSARVSGGRLEVGSVYASVIRRGPLELKADTELIAIEPPRMVEYQGTISGFWSVDRLTFESRDDGTVITFFNESTPPAWLRPVTPLMQASFQKQARRAVEGARRFLEQR